jgi:hypothetical protein
MCSEYYESLSNSRTRRSESKPPEAGPLDGIAEIRLEGEVSL